MSGSGSEQGSPLLRVQGSSRLAFGATTAALITLASGGTAALVVQGTASVSSPTSLPGGLLSETPGAAGPVVVERAPGSPPPPAVPPAAVPVDRTVEALRGALAAPPGTGRRTLVAPLVALSGGGLEATVPVTPSAPVATPAPTAVTVPVVAPTSPVSASPAAAGKGGAHPSRGKAKGRGKGKHAR